MKLKQADTDWLRSKGLWLVQERSALIGWCSMFEDKEL